ncbi:hypothetical protein [Capnocytophaga canimorsus]|uniref:hypothetical protein n=1 Tax=Capnocytophaga canimorsus TaxID=28188 RepID=UPI0005CDB5CE|nr:hypothetical protein [Capnocytophaga canimorsus]
MQPFCPLSQNFPKYQKVYNFDIADNENYYVAEDGILVHNGYSKTDIGENDLSKAVIKYRIDNKINGRVTQSMILKSTQN